MQFFKKNDIVEMAVRMEENGYEFYNEGLKRKDLDEKLIKILMKLRNDEKHHKKTFLALRDKSDIFELNNEIDWDQIEFYVNTLIGTHVFSEPDSAIKLAQNAKNSKEMLEFAIQFEKDTLLFFHTISKYVKRNKSIKAVNSIIDEEVSHVEQLTEVLNTL